jgi:hypothetical protein
MADQSPAGGPPAAGGVTREQLLQFVKTQKATIAKLTQEVEGLRKRCPPGWPTRMTHAFLRSCNCCRGSAGACDETLLTTKRTMG